MKLKIVNNSCHKGLLYLGNQMGDFGLEGCNELAAFWLPKQASQVDFFQSKEERV